MMTLNLAAKICGSKRCCTCKYVSDSANVISSLPFCKLRNLVYKIVCGTCGMGYVGQTSTALNLRINNHRSHIKHNRGKDVEIKHFQSHSFNNISIHILDLIENDKERLITENNCMILHRTIYPYGLNDKHNGHMLTNLQSVECIHRLLPSLKGYKKRKRGNKSFSEHPYKGYVDFKAWFKFWQDNFDTSENIVNTIKRDVNFMSRCKIKQLGNMLMTQILPESHLKSLVLDFCKFRLGISKNDDLILEKNIFYKSFLVIPFPSKQMEKLNLKEILQKQELKEEFPLKETYPSLSYRLAKPLFTQVCNHRKFVEKLDLQHVNELPCVCRQPQYQEYIDKNHEHIITGDLGILNDRELEAIFIHGAKYRFNHKFNKEKLIEQIQVDIQLYISRIAFETGTYDAFFYPWKIKVFQAFKERIENFQVHYPKGSLDISYNKFKELLQEIHKNFVIVTVDKASNNFAFICQRHYGQLLKDEILNSPTFQEQTISFEKARKNIMNACSEFGIKIDSKSTKLPFLFANPKFHKNPIKFRFITSSVNTCVRNLSLRVNEVLDQLLNELESSSMNSHENWIIKNNKGVIKAVKNINIMATAKSIRSWDFTTLYTKIPLDLLHNSIVALFERFLPVGCKFGRKDTIYKERFSQLLRTSLECNYIQVGNRLFQQIVGIPMGSNYSTNMANLFLFFYESKFIKENPLSENYAFTFRYIDDLLAINNDRIDLDINSIYPECMEVEETTYPPYLQAHYLDLNLKIANSQILTKIYDKRRDFFFNILKLPMFRSNIPSHIIKNVIKSQLSRYLQICDLRDDFIFNSDLLHKTLIKNGYPTWMIRKNFKLFNKTHYLPILNKYHGVDVLDIFSSFLK